MRWWMSLWLAQAAAAPLSPEREAATMVEVSFGPPPGHARSAERCARQRETPTASEDDDAEIPLVWSDATSAWRCYFQGRGRRLWRTWRARRPLVVPALTEALRASELPLDLIYLAMIESGWSHTATSRIGAVGLWQLMPDTAEALGLAEGDREDPVQSTTAALRYLEELHASLGDWRLALLAYNAGIGRVSGIARTQTEPTAESVAALLPPEAQNFLPKFDAARWLDRQPAGRARNK
jgi:membrane-bound lytic murein transglycosylase D